MTHYGQSLGDHVNDIVFDDEEQLDDCKNYHILSLSLSFSFIVDATENHFGGFLKKKETQQQTDDNVSDLLNNIRHRSTLYIRRRLVKQGSK